MQESATEVHNAIQKTLQAFQEMKYPVTKMQLIEEAKKLNARSEVIKLSRLVQTGNTQTFPM